MLPKWHIVFGFIVSLILFSFLGVSFSHSAIVFFASFLIDIDHYIFYAVKGKTMDFFNIYRIGLKSSKRWKKLSFTEKRKYSAPLFFFHGIETWILLLFLSLFSNIFLLIFLGFMVHMTLDFIDILVSGTPVGTKLSQIYVYFSNKKKKDFKWV